MNTDKLLKAIQILIKEELKQQLPALIKEGVKAEMKKVLAEGNTKLQPKKESEGFSMAKAILGDATIKESTEVKVLPNKQFSKNPMINQILNETAMAPVSNDGGFRTMNLGKVIWVLL